MKNFFYKIVFKFKCIFSSTCKKLTKHKNNITNGFFFYLYIILQKLPHNPIYGSVTLKNTTQEKKIIKKRKDKLKDSSFITKYQWCL